MVKVKRYLKVYEGRSKNIIPHLRLYTFTILVGVLYPSENHEVDLPLMYRFTAEIKAALVSYLFPASLFFSSGNKKIVAGRSKGWGAKTALYGRWYNNCNLKELISSTVDEHRKHACIILTPLNLPFI